VPEGVVQLGPAWLTGAPMRSRACGAIGTVASRVVAAEVGDIRRARARRPRRAWVPEFRANGGNTQGMHAV
jgi:hypothetical protein